MKSEKPNNIVIKPKFSIAPNKILDKISEKKKLKKSTPLTTTAPPSITTLDAWKNAKMMLHNTIARSIERLRPTGMSNAK